MYELHVKVVFVGDRPSRKNRHPEVALVGTKSYKIFLNWVYRLDLDINRIVLIDSVDEYGNDRLSRHTPDYSRVAFVALGAQAAARLKHHKIKHFVLPHPSEVERKPIDVRDLARLIYRCKKFINIAKN